MAKRINESITEYNTRMNEYMKERYKLRRAKLVDFLGGKCCSCGSSDSLEIDHIDPKSKYKSMAQLSSASESIWKSEASKCQLLCKQCHLEKSKQDGSFENKFREIVCSCGRICTSTKEYSGHKTWCKT